VKRDAKIGEAEAMKDAGIKVVFVMLAVTCKGLVQKYYNYLILFKALFLAKFI